MQGLLRVHQPLRVPQQGCLGDSVRRLVLVALQLLSAAAWEQCRCRTLCRTVCSQTQGPTAAASPHLAQLLVSIESVPVHLVHVYQLPQGVQTDDLQEGSTNTQHSLQCSPSPALSKPAGSPRTEPTRSSPSHRAATSHGAQPKQARLLLRSTSSAPATCTCTALPLPEQS